jgi:hypothetical protein
LPLAHILIHILVFYRFNYHKDTLTEIAQHLNELRLMPLPYGLLPHELIEIIDNERIIPGISYIYK